ncbi:serine hydrolase domain-containing protein [Mariniflexile litorale]|uniref:Serine hydrolase domain-containing protein n=1 Tax=Mariniflexile litorale TaxID=3045158 RepID=A0AAU7ECL6_9FLAO|nr:serine hydrolase domain-containing protein [Mariniflexile sp. KMM 9835]MDQ8210401.1 serine hydrolase domain-containing protein [Mariniflexile sp. KMM 9835]
MKRIIASIMLLLSAIGFTQNTENPSQVKTKAAKKLAKKFLRKHGITGMAISVSQHGELIWSKGFGYSNKKQKIPVKPDTTIFRIASISKSITAVALAKLIDDKLIDLDSSIYNFIPDYPKQIYDITVRQLGGNLAGIRHYKNNIEYALNKKMSITEGLDLFKSDSLLFEPGTQFNYSSFGYVLLSEVMQKATQVPFNTFVSDTIFTPLNMTHSMMDASDVTVPNCTHFYKNSLLKKHILASPVCNEYKIAGGGFLSTSEDLIKFGNELISPKIVSKEALSEIITSQHLKTGERTGYGIGFSIETSKNSTPKYYHTGGGVGASTILMVYPEEELVITVLTNTTGISMPDFGNELEKVFID